ncbi:hypothetical protein QN277_005745 [Acacia crassicarpa]|nr:hypothetical protein QN277_005745 [Acacia crassicarpa]
MANDFLSQSSAKEQIGDNPFLPEDIIITILKRLPVKSLIRFRCVCKDWKDLLKTPSFITEHLHHSVDENPLLFLQWGHKLDPLHFHILNHKGQLLEVQPPLPLMDSSFSIHIVGCSNGLLCLHCNDLETSLRFPLVWNPATREIRQVPSPIKNNIQFLALGFGFSPVDNDYKILVSQERADIDSLSNPLEVYSLRTGSWKEIKVEDFGGLGISDFSVTVNGAMFWFGHKVTNIAENDLFVYHEMVVSFDMVMEVFTLIPLPCDDDNSRKSFLSVYENKLAMLCDTENENYESYRTDLWVMEEGALSSGERWSWTKKYSISTSSSIYLLGIWLDKIVYCSIGLPPYDEPESETNHRTIDVLYTLNLSTHEWVHFNCPQGGYPISIIFNYAESLMPIANIHPRS